MGLDFIRATAKPFNKSVSRDAASVARMGASCATHDRMFLVATLFSSLPTLRVGEELTAHMHDGVIDLIDRHTRVGCIEDPPQSLLDRMRELGGFGTACIEKINPISETADVEIK